MADDEAACNYSSSNGEFGVWGCGVAGWGLGSQLASCGVLDAIEKMTGDEAACKDSSSDGEFWGLAFWGYGVGFWAARGLGSQLASCGALDAIKKMADDEAACNDSSSDGEQQQLSVLVLTPSRCCASCACAQ
jgi:hypothetical protein